MKIRADFLRSTIFIFKNSNKNHNFRTFVVNIINKLGGTGSCMYILCDYHFISRIQFNNLIVTQWYKIIPQAWITCKVHYYVISYTFTKLNGDKVIIIEKMVQTYVLLSHIKKTLSLPSRFGNFGYIYVICG